MMTVIAGGNWEFFALIGYGVVAGNNAIFLNAKDITDVKPGSWCEGGGFLLGLHHELGIMAGQIDFLKIVVGIIHRIDIIYS